MKLQDDLLFDEGDHRQAAAEREGADLEEHGGEVAEARCLCRRGALAAADRSREEVQEGEDCDEPDDDGGADPARIEQQHTRAPGEKDDRRDAERAEAGHRARGQRDRRVEDATHGRPAETKHGDEIDPEHDGAEAVDGAAKDRRRAERGICERECEDDQEAGDDEAKPREQSAPPAAARVPEEDRELRHAGAGQDVGE